MSSVVCMQYASAMFQIKVTKVKMKDSREERRWKEDARCKDARCSKTQNKDLTHQTAT